MTNAMMVARVLLLAGVPIVGPPADSSPSIRSVAVLEQGCKQDVAHDCYQLAVLYGVGGGVPKDHARAARLHKRACDLGEQRGCLGLAAMHIDAEGIAKPSLMRAAELARKACDAGLGEGCFLLASVYTVARMAPDTATDIPAELRPADAVIGKLLSRSCELGYPEACVWAAQSKQSEGKGAGGTMTPLGTAVLSKQCDEGRAESCLALGSITMAGHEGAPMSAEARQAKVRGRQLLEAACKAGNLGSDGCVGLGKMYLENRGDVDEVAKAEEPLQKACSAAFEDGCQGLILLASHYQSGDIVPKNVDKALALQRASCVVPDPCQVPAIVRELKTKIVHEPPFEDPPAAKP